MNPQLWWFLARATGLVAWGLLTASVIWGLLLSTRLTRGRPSPAWLTDLHRFLGGAAVIFTALHVGGLVADNYTHFGLGDVLVPLASAWKPGPVALGVIALYLLISVELTSLLMRRMPRRWWKAIHLSSFGLFWVATLHLVTAGTDASNLIVAVTVDVAATSVVFLTLVRTLSPRTTRGARAPKPRSGQSHRLCPGDTMALMLGVGVAYLTTKTPSPSSLARAEGVRLSNKVCQARV